MTKRIKIISAIALAFVLVIAFSFYLIASPTDRCTNNDRVINNCVPAGKCGPTPEIDSVVDCKIKDYDRKFNTEL